MDAGALLDLLGNENRRRILRLLSRKPCYVTEISEHLGVSPKAVIDHLRKLEGAGLIESRTDDQRRKYFHIARNVRLEVTVAPYGFATKSAYPASPSLDLSSCQHLKIEVSRQRLASASPDAEATDSGAEESEAAGAEVAGADSPGADSADTDSAGADEPGSEPGSEPAEVDGGTAASVDAAADPDASDAADGDAPETARRGVGELEVGPAEIAELAEEVNELEDIERELSLAQRWVQGRIAGVLDELAAAVDDEKEYLHAELIATVARGTTDVEEISRELEVPPGVVEECLRRLQERGILRRSSGEWQIAR